jgi:hypothetical protein
MIQTPGKQSAYESEMSFKRSQAMRTALNAENLFDALSNMEDIAQSIDIRFDKSNRVWIVEMSYCGEIFTGECNVLTIACSEALAKACEAFPYFHLRHAYDAARWLAYNPWGSGDVEMTREQIEQTLCHHKISGKKVVAYKDGIPKEAQCCVHCGRYGFAEDFPIVKQEPHVLYPSCKCPDCVAARASQKANPFL